MRHLLCQVRPDGIPNLMKALALIRPSAASQGAKEVFIRRVRGLEQVPRLEPRLDHILRESHGIMLYEDDALLIAAALAGLPAAEADGFRRAITKCRTEEERQALSARFLGACRAHGTEMPTAIEMWLQMSKFSSYSFCRAHAASYARLAWANAYLKSHFLPEFWVGALNNNEGMYAKWVYVEEAKRTGIRFLPPCVHASAEEFSLEHGSIRIGLGRIHGLSARARQALYQYRPFSGFAELLARTKLRPGEALNLIRVGALNCLGIPRKNLYQELARMRPEMETPGTAENELFFSACARDGSSRLHYQVSETGTLSEAHAAWQILDLSVGPHPVAWIRPLLERHGFAARGAIPQRIGKSIRLCGLAAVLRVANTENGQPMCFITLSDEEGLFEATFWPAAYARNRHALTAQTPGPLWIQGKVESQYDALFINAERIGYVGDLTQAQSRPPLVAVA